MRTTTRNRILAGGLGFILVLFVIAGLAGVFDSSDGSGQYPSNYANRQSLSEVSIR